MSEPTFQERLARRRQQQYDALKLHDFDLYTRSIQAAEAVTLNHNLPSKVAVEIEWAVIGQVCDALRIKPKAPPAPGPDTL